MEIGSIKLSVGISSCSNESRKIVSHFMLGQNIWDVKIVDSENATNSISSFLKDVVRLRKLTKNSLDGYPPWARVFHFDDVPVWEVSLF